MRIISNFKDYYDCMQGYGYDPYIVYNRKARPNFIKGSNYCVPFHKYPLHGYGDKNILEYITHSIGFCGKYYLLLEVFEGGEDKPILQTYCIEDIDKLVELKCNKKDKEFYFGRTSKWEKKRYNIFSRQSVLSSIQRFEEQTIHSDGPFIKNNTPIIINHDKKHNDDVDNPMFWITTFDGCLADVSFYKVMEPWKAYQEIGMYLAGPLCTKYKKIPEIDDKTLAEAKGFDKYSFRKDRS